MAEGFDGFQGVKESDRLQNEFGPVERKGDEIARLEAKMDGAFAASDARLTSLETRVSSGFSRLECRLDRLFELQRRQRSTG
jgi:hypothetical protein